MDNHLLEQLENTKLNIFNNDVITKYKIYNGLFLSLPFKDIDQAGARLAIFTHRCEDGINQNLDPKQIVENYLKRVNIPKDRHIDLLFNFLRYIERQIVLFDAIEDATFANIHTTKDHGPLNSFIQQINTIDNIKLLHNLLKEYKTRIVLTAHPTQFYPNNILGIIANMRDAIKTNNLKQLQEHFLQLGFTTFKNKNKPSPFDEAKTLIYYLEHIFYTSFTKIQQQIHLINNETINLELGFWPGGDRDGNPFVTHDITIKVANLLKTTIIKLYIKEFTELKTSLTFNGISDQLDIIINELESNQYTNDSKHFIKKLQFIKNIIIKDYHNLFLDKIDALITKIKLFGFYFAKIDIRQNSHIHSKIIDTLFSAANITDNYLKLSDKNKINILTKNANNTNILSNVTSPEAQELIDTLVAIHTIQNTNEKNAIERYIISNSESVANIIEILFLIKLVNIKYSTSIFVEIVPLFETIDDLTNSTEIMQTLFKNKWYLEHLKAHNMRQTIMLGFSDGTKDGGYLMANWAILKAKKDLSILGEEKNINIIFFDGRGGPPSRGGGNTRDFYHASSNLINDKEIQLTIQGQTIYSNFGTKNTASYNIEQIFTGGLTAKVLPQKNETINTKQLSIFKKLALLAYKKYYNLKHDPLFIPYLEEITPFKYLSQTNVGSRPATRTNTEEHVNFSNLRAIPFVASWAQLKQNILGYYGVGTAIYEYIKTTPNGLEKLQHFYKHSLFFKTIISNSIQSLIKSNFKITQHLSNHNKYSKFWQQLFKEYNLTERMICKITQQTSLVEEQTVENASSTMREKIIFPLLIIQQYALMKIKDEHPVDKSAYIELIQKAIRTNVNASRNSI